MAALNSRNLIVPERGYGRATGNLPLIPVCDGVGEVVAIGEGVTRVALDARVCPTYFQNWTGGAPSPARRASSLGGPIDGVMAGETTLPLSLRAVRPGGTLSMIGVLSGRKLEASLGPIVARQVRLQGVTVGHRDGLEAMMKAMAQHQIHPVLGETFGFADLKAAMSHLKTGDNFGKTLIGF